MESHLMDRRTVLTLTGAAGIATVSGIGSASAENGRGDGSSRDDARVTVPNQKVDLDAETVEVRVAQATLPDGGFVVIHRDGDPFGGVAGNSSYLEPGVTTNIEIEVSTDDVVDADGNGRKEVVAMAHRDTNDNQDYEFPDADGPYVADGAPVIDTATIKDE